MQVQESALHPFSACSLPPPNGSNAMTPDRISGKAARPRPAKRNREAEVIEAAVEVFAEKGFQSASIQDVAAKVGVLKGSLYYYIDSKEDLLDRIIEDVHQRSTTILSEVQELGLTPLETLRTYIERHVEWYLSNLAEVSVFFREWRHLTGERFETARQRRSGYEAIIRDLISESQKVGAIDKSVDPKYAAFYVLAAVNAVPDWYSSDGPDSARHIAEEFADMTVGLLVGTKARKRSRKRETARRKRETARRSAKKAA